MSQVIDIVSLYPKDMNIYGDSGNVLTIQRRLALYGYEPRVHAYNQGDAWPEHVDMILAAAAKTPARRKSSTTSSSAPACCDRWPPAAPLCS